jgi:phosphatidylethanolamine/phosphatidyl-N-methylethanolamine N-methyltransferase
MPSDGARFLLCYLRRPLSLGAVSPASRRLAGIVGAATREAARNGFDSLPHSASEDADARAASPAVTIVELGAGTGSLSQCISAMNPILVEHNGEWAALLRERFPNLEVRAECATLALARLNTPVGVVSSIPLLGNPKAAVIRKLLARKYEDGLIKFCIAYTYGWSNPLADVGFRYGRRAHFVARNVPPASVWVYR